MMSNSRRIAFLTMNASLDLYSCGILAERSEFRSLADGGCKAVGARFPNILERIKTPPLLLQLMQGS